MTPQNTTVIVYVRTITKNDIHFLATFSQQTYFMKMTTLPMKYKIVLFIPYILFFNAEKIPFETLDNTLVGFEDDNMSLAFTSLSFKVLLPCSNPDPTS